jgi:hypothetical protein
MQVTLNKVNVSDLFFNSEHPYLTAYIADVDNSIYDDGARKALLRDALDFAHLLNNRVDAVWLVLDYFERL